jgi:ribosomal protein L3
MGSDRVTLLGLKVVQIDPATNELLLLGAMAGKKGTLVEIVG